MESQQKLEKRLSGLVGDIRKRFEMSEDDKRFLFEKLEGIINHSAALGRLGDLSGGQDIAKLLREAMDG